MSGGGSVRIGTTIEERTDRDHLVLKHVGLVKVLAQRLAQRLPTQVEIKDLVSVGMLGLIDAASRYKASTGVPFDAFARRRVHGSMLDALRDLDWAPRSLRKRRRDLDQAVSRLRHELGREPSDHEIGVAMGLSPAEYARALDQLRSLELGPMRLVDVPNQDGLSLIELCIDPGESPYARLERTELRDHLAAALARLPDRERQIMALYFEEEMTMAEIGVVLGVCESRVSQLRTIALGRLRVSLRDALRVPVRR